MEARRSAEKLTQEKARQPTLEELADSVEAELGDVGQALLARQSFTAASLDAPMGGEDGPLLADALPDHDHRLQMAPEWSDLSAAMDQLPARQQEILFLRFFEDLSQTEIAQRVGVSQMHVSRLLSKAIDTLRDHVDADTTR